MHTLIFLCSAPSFLWAAEIFPTTIRAKGLSLALFAYFVGQITYTTPGARAFQTIGWHMYLLYMSLCLISTVVVYFYIPETKGLPMEEIGALFGDQVVVHLTSDGHGILEDAKLTDDVHMEDLGVVVGHAASADKGHAPTTSVHMERV